MATYTLSYTGAEVNSAIGNAKDLFSTVHTWTAEQSIADLSVSHDLTADRITVASGLLVNGNASLNSSVVISGNATFMHGLYIFGSDYDLTVEGPAKFYSTSIFNSTATFNGDVVVNTGHQVTIKSPTVLYNHLSFTPNGVYGITGVKDVWSEEYNLGTGGPVGITYSGTGVASATKPGVYITRSGLTTFSIGDAIPADALVITFHN